MSFSVKDKINLKNEIPNKAQVPILNHRDDGEMREVKIESDTCKVFCLTTLRELQFTHKFVDCEVAIAEDFFWTAMPFIVNGEIHREEDGHDAVNSCILASTWGTPCVITPDGDVYACYKVLPKDEFPGVYLKDWPIDFLAKEVDESCEYIEKKIREIESQLL